MLSHSSTVLTVKAEVEKSAKLASLLEKYSEKQRNSRVNARQNNKGGDLKLVDYSQELLICIHGRMVIKTADATFVC